VLFYLTVVPLFLAVLVFMALTTVLVFLGISGFW
jgi:hypothetical protein